MATLAQRVQVVEGETERLETLLARRMARTDDALAKAAVIAENAAVAAANAAAAAAENRIAITENNAAISESKTVAENAAVAAAENRIAIAKTDAAISRLERAIDRMEQDSARDRAEAARERKERNKRWGELANKMGTVVEDIVAPSVRRLASEVFDCGKLKYFATRVSLQRSDDRSREHEFDALYVGTRAVLLNSTKSSPRSSDARELAQFLERGEFALYFPQYRDLPIVPVFSSLSIPEDLLTFLTRLGIFALGMGDEAMQVLNLEAVRRRRTAR